MATPRVSVIMPSYNHAEFVGQAVESVLSQSYHDLELIVTDDGSTDGTAEIVRGYDDPRIRLEVFPQNQGAAQATNRCIERARGEFVALLNSDDFFLPGKLDLQVRMLTRRRDLAAVFSQVRFVDEQGSDVSAEKNPFAGLFSTVFLNRYGWLGSFFLRGNGLCHPTILIRRNVYEELGPFDPSMRQLHDFDMWVRLCGRHEINVMPEVLLGYRVLTSGGNASAPGAAVFRRTSWEHTRVRHRYRAMDDAVLRRAFGDHIPDAVAARGLPMAVQLALMAGGLAGPQFHLFALETLQDAVERGVAGVGPKDIHALAGLIDPFRQLEIEAASQNLEVVTQQRDEARLQVAGLAGYLRNRMEALRHGDVPDVMEEMGTLLRSIEQAEVSRPATHDGPTETA